MAVPVDKCQKVVRGTQLDGSCGPARAVRDSPGPPVRGTPGDQHLPHRDPTLRREFEVCPSILMLIKMRFVDEGRPILRKRSLDLQKIQEIFS